MRKGATVAAEKIVETRRKYFFAKSDKKAETGVFRQIPKTLKHGRGKEREDGFFRFLSF